MKRGLSFTILALLGLLASVAMAMDNNWPGAALGCVAAGLPLCHGNRLVPQFEPSRRETLAPVKSPAEAAACPLSLPARPVLA